MQLSLAQSLAGRVTPSARRVAALPLQQQRTSRASASRPAQRAVAVMASAGDKSE